MRKGQILTDFKIFFGLDLYLQKQTFVPYYILGFSAHPIVHVEDLKNF